MARFARETAAPLYTATSRESTRESAKGSGWEVHGLRVLRGNARGNYRGNKQGLTRRTRSREGNYIVQQLHFASFALNAGGGDLYQDPQDKVKWSSSSRMQVDQDRGEHDEGKRTGEERGFFSTDGLRSDMEVAPLPVPTAEHTHVGALALLMT